MKTLIVLLLVAAVAYFVLRELRHDRKRREEGPATGRAGGRKGDGPSPGKV